MEIAILVLLALNLMMSLSESGRLGELDTKVSALYLSLMKAKNVNEENTDGDQRS